jgi:hypothetical protein
VAGPDWGTPPWRVEVALEAAPLPDRCEVAIVGAGLTGLSAAYHLARRGARAVVVDAADPGAGASGRTGGIVLEGTAAGPREGADDCIAHLARVAEEAGIECDLRLPGCWELEHGKRGRALWSEGEAALAIARTVPGGAVDPGALVAGLARAASAAGATIHPRCPVTRLEPGPPAVLRVGERSLVADHVVLALSAYTTELVTLPVEVHSALTLALATAPLDERTLDAIGLGGRMPFYTADLPYLWGRVTPDGRLIAGAGLVFPPDGRVSGITCSDPEAAVGFTRLEARVRGLHPALATVPVTARWGGPVAFTAHREPLLGPLPGAPHVLVTGAYAGHGVALAVRVGALVADALAAGRALPAWGALASS